MSLGGGGGGTTQTTKVEIPPWAEDAARRILDRANVISQQPYTPYPAARLAPFNDDHQAAFSLTRMLPQRFGQGAAQGADGQSSGVMGALAQMLGQGGETAAATAAPAESVSLDAMMEQVFGPGGSSMVNGKPTVTQGGSFVPTPLPTPGFDPFTYGQTGGEALFMRGTPGNMTPLPTLLPVSGSGGSGGSDGSGGSGGTGGSRTSRRTSGRTGQDGYTGSRVSGGGGGNR